MSSSKGAAVAYLAILAILPLLLLVNLAFGWVHLTVGGVWWQEAACALCAYLLLVLFATAITVRR